MTLSLMLTMIEAADHDRSLIDAWNEKQEINSL